MLVNIKEVRVSAPQNLHFQPRNKMILFVIYFENRVISVREHTQNDIYREQ